MRCSTSRQRTARSTLVCLLAVGALLGCDVTALRLLVVGELSVPDDTDELVVRVRSADEEASSRYLLSERSTTLRESLTLLPGERMRDDIHVEVTALKGARVVASGGIDGAFREGAIEELIVTLSPGVDGGSPDGGDVDAGPSEPDAGARDCVDPDGDGYGDGPDCLDLDCDESDDEVNPGAVEECNDIDDDCDFGIDEGCPCSLAENHICGNIVGECRYGYQVCVSGSWSACDGATLPTAEICDNNDDDDCDGVSDEGCP